MPNGADYASAAEHAPRDRRTSRGVPAPRAVDQSRATPEPDAVYSRHPAVARTLVRDGGNQT